MKKILAFIYTSAVLMTVIISSQLAYADVIMPGQSPGGHGRRIVHYPLTQDEVLAYAFTAVVVSVIVILSIIVLYKLRKNK